MTPPTSISGHNHTHTLMNTSRTSSGGCLAAREHGRDFVVLMAGLEECINNGELLSSVHSCTVCQDCWFFHGWFVHNVFMEVKDWVPLKTQGPEFPRGKLKSSLSNVSA